MEQVVIKTEVQNNGEILLFYVDENGGTEQSILTTVESIENSGIDLQNINPYATEVHFDETHFEISQSNKLTFPLENWTDEEIQRLLVFYNDNKQAFVTGSTKRIHLWTIACKTMIFNKTPISCDRKLKFLKDSYVQVCRTRTQQGMSMEIIDLCHQAFGDDPEIHSILSQEEKVRPQPTRVEDSSLVLKKLTTNKPEQKVEKMLQLYLKYKKQFQQEHYTRSLWDNIAMQLGEDDGVFWQKRFMNYKQHYIGLLEKKMQGIVEFNWPYMALYDKIFKDDIEFRRKYPFSDDSNTSNETLTQHHNIWFETEKVVLIKHQYDCFDDFQDPKIPKGFLWNEISRLLDKPADLCKKKVLDLKKEHYIKYEDNYDLSSRKPLEILLDYVICKDIECEIRKTKNDSDTFEIYKSEEVDEIVQFIYDNTEIFKDPICHFVCFGVIAKNLKRKVGSVKRKWQELVTLYKIILEDKKENPDMQIDWRYIELFDRIFAYGMDTKLLEGYEKTDNNISHDKKQASIEKDTNGTDYESNDEINTKKSKHLGESKAFKILGYYLKNKIKFQKTTNKNKNTLWNVLAPRLGITATQCAHRFRNLKQVYTAYVQREISKPEMPIMWPYYTLCKKVFGYRALKTKLKNGKNNSDTEDWSPKEIKSLINFFSKNFHDITNNIDDASHWRPIAAEIDKTTNSCKDKFLELRKSYRKLKTQISRNPNVKISWKYFKMFEDIYNSNREGEMEVDDNHEDEDYECIIVLPEGADISDIENSQMMIQENSENGENAQEEESIAQEEESIAQEEEDIAQEEENIAQEEENIAQEEENIAQEEEENIMQEQETTEPMDVTEPMQENSEMISIAIDIQAILDDTDSQPAIQDTPKTIKKWTKKSKRRLLILYINYIRSNKGKEINTKDMWRDIGKKLDRRPIICKKMLAKLKNRYLKNKSDRTKDPLSDLLEKLIKLKPKFVKNRVYNDVSIPADKVTKALNYYLQYIEDFSNPKFDKRFLWTELANHVSEPVPKIISKINYLKQAYNDDYITEENAQFIEILKEIIAKEIAINLVTEIEVKSNLDYTESPWSETDVEQLLEWYLSNLDKFKHPKYVRSYLWKEASEIMKRSPLDCSRKMSEIRSQYRSLVKQDNPELATWKFQALCQKIYGTGKKGNNTVNNL